MRWLFAFMLLVANSYVLSQPADPPELFVEAYVSLSEPYAGQQIEFQVRFFDSIGVANPSYEAPSFEGFWRVEPDRISRTIEVRGSRQYNVTDIRTTLYPNVPGDIVIETARVIVPETVFAPEQLFETVSLLVRARALPEGAPLGFSGAVGEVTLQAGLDRQQVKVGEPITLRLLLLGTANVLVLPPPDITALQGWRAYVQSRSATFETSAPGLIGQQEISIVLFPSQVGNFVLPALSFSYFDPAAAIYRQLGTGEIPLEVLPSVDANSEPAPEVSVAPPFREINLNPEGTLEIWFWPWALWMIGPGTLLLSWLWRQRSVIVDRWFQGEAGSRIPLIRSRHAIRAAMRSQNPASNLQSALHTYLASHSPPEKSASLMDIADHLSQSRLNDAMTTRLHSVLESMNAVQYAPLELVSKTELRQLAQLVDTLLVDLDAALK